MGRGRAAIAAFYGINPFQRSSVQALALWANIPRLQAKRTRRELMLRPDIKLTVDGLYDLVFAETEDADVASKTASDYAFQLLRRNEKVE